MKNKARAQKPSCPDPKPNNADIKHKNKVDGCAVTGFKLD